MRATKSNSGFTQIELVVVSAMLLLAIAVVLPSIQRSRVDARDLRCRNHLRMFGVALWQTAEGDQQGYFNSGSHDYLRDGCYDTYGWVANIVNGAYGLPSHMLCSMQPPSTMQTYQDLFGLKEFKSSVLPQEFIHRLEEGACKNWLNSAEEGGTKTYFEDNFVKKGYTTNYAASWFLVRTTIKYDPNETKMIPAGKAREMGGTIGPLSLKFLEKCDLPVSNIPLLGDVFLTPLTKSNIKKTQIEQPATAKRTRGGNRNKTGYDPQLIYQEPEALANSMTPGPMTFDVDKNQFVLLDDLQDNTKFFEESINDVMPSPNDAMIMEYQHSVDNAKKYLKNYGKGDNLWMQDTRTWGVHNSGNKSANVAFADGSVKTIPDLNGDGLLNPGFPSTKSIDPKQINFHSLKVELPSYICFSGTYLKSPKAVKFE